LAETVIDSQSTISYF